MRSSVRRCVAGLAGLLAAAWLPAAQCRLGTTRWFDERSPSCNGQGPVAGCETARITMVNRWRYGTEEYLVVSTLTSVDIYRLDEHGEPVLVHRAGPFEPWGVPVAPGSVDRLQWDVAMLDDYPYGIALFPHHGWVAFEVANPQDPTGYAVKSAYRGAESPTPRGTHAALFRADGHVYAIGPFLHTASDDLVVASFDDPTSMALVGVTGLPATHRVEAAELQGHPYLLARDRDNAYRGIELYDLATPSSPAWIATVRPDGPIADWQVDAVRGQLVVLVGRTPTSRPRIHRYDLSDPADPAESPAMPLEDNDYTMVAISGDLVVAAQAVSGGADAAAPPFMQAFSVADPQRPAEIARGELEIGGFGAEEDDVGQVDGMTVVRAADGDYTVIRAAYAVGTATRIAGTCVSGPAPVAAFAVSGGATAARCGGAATAPSQETAARGFPGNLFTVVDHSGASRSATIEVHHVESGVPVRKVAPTPIEGRTFGWQTLPRAETGEYMLTLRTFDGSAGTGAPLASTTRSVWLCPDPQASLRLTLAGVACGSSCAGLLGDQVALDATATSGVPIDYVFAHADGGPTVTAVQSTPRLESSLPTYGVRASGVAVRYGFPSATDEGDCGAPLFAALGLAGNRTYDSCRVAPAIGVGEITARIGASQEGVAVPDGGVVKPTADLLLEWQGRVLPGKTPALTWSLTPGSWTAVGPRATIPSGLPSGTYRVTLTASTLRDTVTASFGFVRPDTSFGFTSSATVVEVGEEVTLTLDNVPVRTYAAVSFDVGGPTCDGGPVVVPCAGGECATGETVRFAYAEAARGRTATIVATGILATGGAATAGTVVNLTVAESGGACPNACTVAVTSITPVAATTGQNTTFTATATASTGRIAGYDWAWGDGASSPDAGPSASHAFASPGVATVGVTARSSCGGSASRTVNVSVSPAPGGLTVTFLPELPRPGETVTFTLSPPVSLADDQITLSFGDGTSAQVRPNCGGIFGGGCGPVDSGSHAFQQAGSFAVTASGTARGLAVSGSTRVVVRPVCNALPPIASFTWSPAVPSFGQPVQFSDLSVRGPGTWAWSFGDELPPMIAAGTSSQRHPRYAFQREGAFPVTLTATNCAGTSARRLEVPVCRSKAVPAADFAWAPQGELPGYPGQLQPYAGQEVTFSDRSSQAPSDWQWTDFSELAGDFRGTPAVRVTWDQPGVKLVRLRARNCVGWSAERVVAVTVHEDVRPVTADFDAPDTMETSVATTLTARTGPGYGDPTDFTWRFSDGGEEAGQSVSYTTSCRGRLDVTLLAARGSHSATATRTVSVRGARCGPEAIVVPDAARAGGLNGTEWRTDLRLFNPSGQVTQVDIEALREGRDNSAPAKVGPYPVPARGALVLADVLGLFGDPTLGKAALRITYVNPDDEPPVVAGRTYTTAAGGGSYGQSMRGVPLWRSPGPRELWIAGLRDDGLAAGYRANLGLTNLSAAPVAGVTVTAFDSAGNVVARNADVALPPLGFAQGPLARFGVAVAEVGPFALRVELPEGAEVLPCATLVDNISGDPTALCGAAPAEGLAVLPAVVRLADVLGRTWRSDVHLTNPYGQPRTWRLEFTPEQPDVSGALRSVTLAPNASLAIPDVVSWIYQEERVASGVLEIRSIDGRDGAPVAVARTFTLGGEGSYGQGVPAVGAAAGASAVGETRRLLLTGMSGEAIGRSTLGFANLGEGAVRFDVAFYDEAGRALVEPGRIAVQLGPGGWRQDDLETRFRGLGLELPPGVQVVSAEVRVTEGGPGFAYATVVDPGSGDGVFIAGEAAPDYSQRRPTPRVRPQ